MVEFIGEIGEVGRSEVEGACAGVADLIEAGAVVTEFDGDFSRILLLCGGEELLGELVEAGDRGVGVADGGEDVALLEVVEAEALLVGAGVEQEEGFGFVEGEEVAEVVSEVDEFHAEEFVDGSVGGKVEGLEGDGEGLGVGGEREVFVVEERAVGGGGLGEEEGGSTFGEAAEFEAAGGVGEDGFAVVEADIVVVRLSVEGLDEDAGEGFAGEIEGGAGDGVAVAEADVEVGAGVRGRGDGRLGVRRRGSRGGGIRGGRVRRGGRRCRGRSWRRGSRWRIGRRDRF